MLVKRVKAFGLYRKNGERRQGPLRGDVGLSSTKDKLAKGHIAVVAQIDKFILLLFFSWKIKFILEIRYRDYK